MNTSHRLLRLHAAPIALLLTLVFAAVHTQNAFAQNNCGLNPLTGPVGLTGCDVDFGPQTFYTGRGQSSVAMNSAGLVVETHHGTSTDDLWYRVGKLDATSETINWSIDRRTETLGYWPAVALGENGWVYLMYSDGSFRNTSKQYYRVGILNPSGDQNQEIVWKTKNLPVSGDSGYHASLSVLGDLLVGVYETGGYSDTCSYAIGRVNNPNNNDFGIHWYTGAGNKRTISGLKCVNPHIAVVAGGRYGQGQILLVYDVGDRRIVYERGSIQPAANNAKQMVWETGAHDVTTDVGNQPALALLPNGLAIEVHLQNSDNNLRSTVGKVDLSTWNALIDWAPSKYFDPPSTATYPALTSNGAVAVETDNQGSIGGTFLYYGVSPIW
jgi:hypothetical protein